MASNYTTNYNLCQWEATDQVQRTDFNADNAKLDAALAAKAEAAALNSLTQTVNQKASQSALTAAIATIPKVAAGTYTGDGTENRVISVGFTPKAVLVMNQWGMAYYSDLSGRYYRGGLAVQGSPSTMNQEDGDDFACIAVVSGGFQVTVFEYKTTHCQVNQSGVRFHYLAIG